MDADRKGCERHRRRNEDLQDAVGAPDHLLDEPAAGFGASRQDRADEDKVHEGSLTVTTRPKNWIWRLSLVDRDSVKYNGPA